MSDRIDPLVEDCRKMLESGEHTEGVLSFLRRNNCSKTDSIKVLILLKDLSLSQAKQIVHFSEAWKDTKRADEEFHDRLQATIELGKDEQ